MKAERKVEQKAERMLCEFRSLRVLVDSARGGVELVSVVSTKRRPTRVAARIPRPLVERRLFFLAREEVSELVDALSGWLHDAVE